MFTRPHDQTQAEIAKRLQQISDSRARQASSDEQKAATAVHVDIAQQHPLVMASNAIQESIRILEKGLDVVFGNPPRAEQKLGDIDPKTTSSSLLKDVRDTLISEAVGAGTYVGVSAATKVAASGAGVVFPAAKLLATDIGSGTVGWLSGIITRKITYACLQNQTDPLVEQTNELSDKVSQHLNTYAQDQINIISEELIRIMLYLERNNDASVDTLNPLFSQLSRAIIAVSHNPQDPTYWDNFAKLFGQRKPVDPHDLQRAMFDMVITTIRKSQSASVFGWGWLNKLIENDGGPLIRTVLNIVNWVLSIFNMNTYRLSSAVRTQLNTYVEKLEVAKNLTLTGSLRAASLKVDESMQLYARELATHAKTGIVINSPHVLVGSPQAWYSDHMMRPANASEQKEFTPAELIEVGQWQIRELIENPRQIAQVLQQTLAFIGNTEQQSNAAAFDMSYKVRLQILQIAAHEKVTQHPDAMAAIEKAYVELGGEARDIENVQALENLAIQQDLTLAVQELSAQLASSKYPVMHGSPVLWLSVDADKREQKLTQNQIITAENVDKFIRNTNSFMTALKDKSPQQYELYRLFIIKQAAELINSPDLAISYKMGQFLESLGVSTSNSISICHLAFEQYAQCNFKYLLTTLISSVNDQLDLSSQLFNRTTPSHHAHMAILLGKGQTSDADAKDDGEHAPLRRTGFWVDSKTSTYQAVPTAVNEGSRTPTVRGG